MTRSGSRAGLPVQIGAGGTGTASTKLVVSLAKAFAAAGFRLPAVQDEVSLRHHAAQVLATPMPSGISRYVVLVDTQSNPGNWIITRQSTNRSSEIEILGQSPNQREQIEFARWWNASFGPLDYPRTMRFMIPGMTLAALGFQTILFSFFTNIPGMRRK